MKNNPNHIEGTLSIGGRGIGYVRTKDERFKKGIEIDPAFLNTGLQGDTVKVLLHPHREGRPQTGEIEQVLVRSKAGFAGRLEMFDGVYGLIPSDPKMYTDIIIPKDELHGAKVGQKIFVTITEWTDSKQAPIGRVAKILGTPGENNAEMLAIALEKGFASDFPAAVEHEAEKFGREVKITDTELKERKDFRGTLTFTIDPEDAKDFDDALSFKELDADTYEIGIHIADVSHYLRPGTALDKEAVRRGTSVYLVDRTIPMLPEVLSNALCSLVPHEDRLTMAAVFTMGKDGHVKSEWFGKTIIHSNHRFTYENAQKVLDDKEGLYYKELHTLNMIAKKLTKKRFEEGAISLDQEEVKFVLDENGVPLRVYKKIRQDTNKLIEEFMLLANKKVAEFIGKAKGAEKVFVYRVHDLPNTEKIADLLFFLKRIGYDVPSENGQVKSKDLNALLAKLEGKEEKNAIQTAIIRSMAKAIYSTTNIGHYGLGFKHYTHFTSPIRRYPDVVVHRLLDGYLHDKHIDQELWHEYVTISNFSSQREKEAADAERASIKYKQVEYMSSRIGATFDGVISGVSEWGIFVEEKETKCEGMVRLGSLGDDFYSLDEKQMMIVGQKKHKKFRIGDKVKIKVINADLNKKVIDYAFV